MVRRAPALAAARPELALDLVDPLEVQLEWAVARAITESLSPYRTPSGGYRLENEWHYLVAAA